VSNQGVTKMSYTVPKFRNEQILAMTDDELFTELKKMKRIIHKKRKVGQNTEKAEVEICYLQAEAQKRGHKV
tara:strand:+ start:1453 stop:1668 length:216 start_codon:yes stop_codon:yes gene_type:complete